MRRLLKNTLVSLLIFLMAACSATRKRATNFEGRENKGMGYAAVTARVRENNITEEGFVLKKGRIDIEGSALDGSYPVNAKFNKKGDLNASVRGPLGIELVRLISKDGNIFLIDRINRAIYKGKTGEVLKRYGLPENIMSIIFGDLVGDGTVNYSMSGRETILMEEETSGTNRIMTICVKEEKVCEEVYRDVLTGNEVKLKYGNFRTADGKRYPSEITMVQGDKLQVRLRIEDLTCGFDEEINSDMPAYRTGNL